METLDLLDSLIRVAKLQGDSDGETAASVLEAIKLSLLDDISTLVKKVEATLPNVIEFIMDDPDRLANVAKYETIQDVLKVFNEHWGQNGE